MDSELAKVIVAYSPFQLSRRWKYIDEETGDISYDGYALVPKFKVTTKAKFSLKKVKHVMHDRNKNLAKKWDTYFNDLINIGHTHLIHTKQFHLTSFYEDMRIFWLRKLLTGTELQRIPN